MKFSLAVKSTAKDDVWCFMAGFESATDRGTINVAGNSRCSGLSEDPSDSEGLID